MAAKQQKVQLFKDQELGHGAYGKVCKAECDGIPCAAKILHPLLCSELNDGRKNLMRKFVEECDRMSSFNNPFIVQCFGTYQDPQTKQLVLLMELMDKSLTDFLEQSNDCPYHIQVNICHDVALALAYLHSHDVVHRDLSSNNVLLIGNGNRAKVTDFGMSKLNPHNKSATLSPGCLVYMPPEALTSGCYDEKLDIFSFGVLAVQLLTGDFPQLMGDNAKSHNDLGDPKHPLLSLALECQKDKPRKRPSAKKLCVQLTTLKKSQRYKDSEQFRHWMTEKAALQEKIAEYSHSLHCAHAMISELKDQLEAKNSTLLLLEGIRLSQQLVIILIR